MEFCGVTPVYENFAPNFLEHTEKACNLTVKHSITPYCHTFDATVSVFEVNGRRYAEINVSEASDCTIRYFTCKELMHIHLMNDANRTATREDFDRMLGELTNVANLDQQSLSRQSIVDLAAYYGAIELLMPTFRLNFLRQECGITEIKEIAEFFRIPTSLVEQALSPNVRRFFTE